LEETTKREWETELDEYIVGIEERLGRKLDEGYEKKAISMRLTFDVVRMFHRPLVWYFVSQTVSFLVLCLSSRFYFTSYTPLQITLLAECPPQIVFLVDCYTSVRLLALGFNHYTPRKWWWF
jgi:hypothetical protein